MPGASEPRLTVLPARTCFRSSYRLRGNRNRSIVVVGNYKKSPITVEQCRAKAHPLHPRRSYFAPAATRSGNGLWWRRRVLPPGPKGLLRRPFIAIAGLRRQTQYKHRRLPKEEQIGGRPGGGRFGPCWPVRGRVLRCASSVNHDASLVNES